MFLGKTRCSKYLPATLWGILQPGGLGGEGNSLQRTSTPSRESSNALKRRSIFYVSLFFASVTWTCVWIVAAHSEAVIWLTWWTRTASRLPVTRLRCVKSAMCPRQMATLKFPLLRRAPRKDQLRNVSRDTIAVADFPFVNGLSYHW